MTILFLVSAGLCGIANYTQLLINHLRQLQPDWQLDVYPIDMAWMKQASREEIWQFFQDFCEKAKRYDKVHIQNEFGLLAGNHGTAFANEMTARMLEVLPKGKVVLTLHTTPGVFFQESYKPFFRKLRRSRKYIYQWMPKLYYQTWQAAHDIWRKRIAPHFGPMGQQRLIVHNRFSLQDVLSLGSHPDYVTSHPIGVESLPYSDEDYSYQLEQVKLNLNWEPGDQILGTFGFISASKGYLSAIDALSLLPENVKLLMVGGAHPNGDRAYPNALLERAKVHGVFDRVYMTGSYQYDALRAYASLIDLVLVPYLPPYPSSSAAIAIPLSLGKPIIASNIDSFREVAELGDCLELMEPQAGFQLAHLVRQLLHDSRRLQQLSVNALRYAQTYSWERFAQHHVQQYTASTVAVGC